MTAQVSASLSPDEHRELERVTITLGALVTLVGAGWRPRRFGLRWIAVANSAGAASFREELGALGLTITAVYRLSDGGKVWLIAEVDG
jgi:hypothetical protein